MALYCFPHCSSSLIVPFSIIVTVYLTFPLSSNQHILYLCSPGLQANYHTHMYILLSSCALCNNHSVLLFIAMAVPSHHIHIIHSSPSILSLLSVSTAQASSFMHLLNISVSSPHSRGVSLSILSAWTAVATPSSSLVHRPPIQIPPGTHCAPSQPPHTVMISTKDPFADQLEFAEIPRLPL